MIRELNDTGVSNEKMEAR